MMANEPLWQRDIRRLSVDDLRRMPAALRRIYDATMAENNELTKQVADLVRERDNLRDFVEDIAAGPHEDICPLEHPAYRNKWCDCCEARKLLGLEPHPKKYKAAEP